MSFDTRLLSGIGVMAAVVESGNFARAGDALGLTPSGVSRAIARLEARIGVRLFARTPRAVALTEEGRRFHAQVAPLLAGLEEAAEDAAGARSRVRGRLRVNVDPWFACFVLAPGLPDFLADYPDLTLEMMVRDTLGDLVGEGFDLAIRLGVPEPSSLIVRNLLQTRVVTCASPAYLDRHGRPRHPGELQHHACILFRDPSTGRPFPWEFHRGGEVIVGRASGQLVVNDFATALAACIAGAGLIQPLEVGLGEALAAGAVELVLTDWADELFPLYAYYPSRQQPPAKVRAFLDFVRRRISAATPKGGTGGAKGPAGEG